MIKDQECYTVQLRKYLAECERVGVNSDFIVMVENALSLVNLSINQFEERLFYTSRAALYDAHTALNRQFTSITGIMNPLRPLDLLN